MGSVKRALVIRTSPQGSEVKIPGENAFLWPYKLVVGKHWAYFDDRGNVISIVKEIQQAACFENPPECWDYDALDCGDY